MAKFLMVQANRMVSGVQYSGVSSLAAHVKKAGHRFDLFDCAGYRPFEERDDDRTPRAQADNPVPLLFRPLPPGTPLPEKREMARLPEDLTDRIARTGPDVMGFSCFSDDWPFALWLIRRVKADFPQIPIVVGGIHATIAPEEAIRHEEIAAVCVGEGEQALVDLLDSHRGGRFDPSIENFWFKDAGGIRKNPQRALFRFDADTPFADWSFYDDLHFIYPFEGRLYRRGSVALSRGCPYSCSFCVNDFLKAGQNGRAYPVRRKDAGYAVDELVHLKETHGLEFLRFWDETFLALPMTYLRDFSAQYRARVDLPFTIETTADSITLEKARILKEMGCLSVSVGVETADPDLRQRLLKKKITNDRYARAFGILTDLGIRKVANFMFLLPHQSVEEMYRCIQLCAEWQVDSPSPRIFYPYRGTALREYCLRQGLVDTRRLAALEDEDRMQSLEALSTEYRTFESTVLRIPENVQARARLLMDNFVLLQETPAWMHGWLLDLLGRDDRETASALDGLRQAVSEKRFGSGGERLP